MSLSERGVPFPVVQADINLLEKALGVRLPESLLEIYRVKGGFTLEIAGGLCFAVHSPYYFMHNCEGACEVYGCAPRDLKDRKLVLFAMSDSYADLYLHYQPGHSIRVVGNITLTDDGFECEKEWPNVDLCLKWFTNRVLVTKGDGVDVVMQLFSDGQLKELKTKRENFRNSFMEFFR